MYAENFLCNDGRDRQAIKSIDECFPDLDVASPLAFVVKAVDASYVGAFVVSAEKEEILRELQLVAHEQEDRFQTLLAAVDIITQE